MIKLVIKKGDGSDYWTENFDKISHAQRWLTEEKTRPYWGQDFTYEIIDNTPPEPTQAEKDAIALADQTKRTQLSNLITRIKELDNQPDLTTVELKENLRKLVKFLIAKGFLDI